MLAGSTLELSWDNEIKNGLEPAVSIQYTGSSNLFFTPSATDYNFSVSHKTYCSDVSLLYPLLMIVRHKYDDHDENTWVNRVGGIP